MTKSALAIAAPSEAITANCAYAISKRGGGQNIVDFSDDPTALMAYLHTLSDPTETKVAQATHDGPAIRQSPRDRMRARSRHQSRPMISHPGIPHANEVRVAETGPVVAILQAPFAQGHALVIDPPGQTAAV